MVKLGDLIKPAKVVRCGASQYPVLSMTMHDGIILQSDRFKKSLASVDQSDYKVVKHGQLVVGFPIDEGVLYIQKVVSAGIMSPTYNVWDVNYDIIDPLYLELSLHSPQAMQYYKENLRGTTARRRSIPTDTLLALPLPLPSLDEQRKIAAVLDKVSDLIAKRRQQLDKLDEMVKAKFVEMFGNPVNNTLNLPLLSLSQLGEFGRGVSKHRPRNAPELLGGKYPLIQTGEVANSGLYISSYKNTYSELGFRQSKMWKSGTLCITIAANIAKTSILAFDACFPDSVVGFVANEKTNNIFIHYWFSFFQQILEAQAPESAPKNINLKILGELKVIVPPIELQNKFATFVDQTEKSKKNISHSLEKLETLKKALMQKYFV